MTNQPFPVLSASEFVRKAERVISVLKNIDLSKSISTQFMIAAACMEIAEFNECLKATQKSEVQIYTGGFLACTPPLGIYIRHFKEVKNYINDSKYPEAVWRYKQEYEPFEYDKNISSQIQKNKEKALARDLKTLECIKNHDSVSELQSEEYRLHNDFIIINDEVYLTNPEKNGVPRNYMTLIDSWASGLKTSLEDNVFILLKQCEDTIIEIMNLNKISYNPSADALAKGIEIMFSKFLIHNWIEEQAKIELEIELLLREYDEEDKEGINNTLISFYEKLKEEKKPSHQDYCFVQLWHKHLFKAKTPDAYLAFAKEMLSKWNTYKIFFVDALLGRCFYEIQMDEYISNELRELRKAGREIHKQKAKENKEKLIGVLDTELAREIFAKSIEKGWMHETENGFQWEGIPNSRGKIAQLSYLCGKIYGFKYSDREGKNIGKEFPDAELCKLFNIESMGKQLVQVYQATNKQKWRTVIDELFE